MSYNIKSYSKLSSKLILQIETFCNQYDYNAYYESTSCNKEKCFYIAFDNNSIIGFLSFLWIPYEPTTEITAIVNPAFRHQKVFTSLLVAALPEIKRLNIQSLYALNNNINPTDTNFSHCEYLFSMDYETSKNLKPSKEHLVYRNLSLYKKGSSLPLSTCNLDYQDSFTNLWGVETQKKERRKGYAYTLLCNVILEYFNNPSNQNKPLILQVSGNNLPALNLYKNLGFIQKECINYAKILIP